MAPAQKWARCRGCRAWWRLDKVATEECPSCTYTTHRCSDCGGAAGALRSVLSHLWCFVLRKGEGGHSGVMIDKVLSRREREAA
jgi:hypothetical protein